MRKEMTLQEKRLWYDFLCDYPVRFQWQKTINSFIADFYCYQARLIIEVYGTQHHTNQGKAYDLERSAILDRYGLKVIRFTNQEIDRQFMTVCAKIDRTVHERIIKE